MVFTWDLFDQNPRENKSQRALSALPLLRNPCVCSGLCSIEDRNTSIPGDVRSGPLVGGNHIAQSEPHHFLGIYSSTQTIRFFFLSRESSRRLYQNYDIFWIPYEMISTAQLASQLSKALTVGIHLYHFYSTLLDWSSRLGHSLIQNKAQVILTLSLSWLQLSTHWLSSSKPLVHSYMPSKTGEGGSHTTGMQLPCSQVPFSRHCIFRNFLMRHKT